MIRLIKGDFEAAQFEAELAPNAPLSAKNSLIAQTVAGVLLGSTAALSITLTQGKAWPIAAYAAATMLALQYGFSQAIRNASERQHLTMNENGLTIVHIHPDRSPITLHAPVPKYARLEETQSRGLTKLTFRLFQQRMPLGQFLPAHETKKLKQNLMVAIENWQETPKP